MAQHSWTRFRSQREGDPSRFHMEASGWAGPSCFNAGVSGSSCLSHLSYKRSEAVAVGAALKVDRSVVGPDSATLSRIILLPADTDMESKRSKRQHVNERQSYAENLGIILWGLRDGFELCE